MTIKLRLAQRASIIARVSPRLGSSVAAGNGITVTFGGNVYTVAVNAGAGIFQLADADLTALANNSTNGLWAHTAPGAGAARTITGTANEIIVTNGDGVSGNPTLSLADDVTATNAIVVTPELFGAVGNGVTDDTQAWRDLATYISGLGGGVTVEGTPGATYLIYPESGGTPGNEAIVNLTDCVGVTFNFNGSSWVTDNDFTAQGSQIYGFLFTTCTGIDVHNFKLDHSAISGTLASDKGLIGIYLNGSTRATISDFWQIGGMGGISCNGKQPYDDATVRAAQVDISNFLTDTVYYPLQAEFANDVFVTGMRTINVGRSLFLANANNIYVKLWSNNGGPFDDIIIDVSCVAGATANTNTTSNIRIDYYNPVRTVALTGVLNSLVSLNFLQTSASTAAGIIRNVHLNYAVDGATLSVIGLRTVKATHTGTIPDPTARGHTLENIEITGRFANWTTSVATMFDATWWGAAGGDTIRNIIFRDLVYSGVGSSINIVASDIDQNLVFENVVGTTNLNVSGLATGVFRATNLRVPNINEVLVLSGSTSGAVTQTVQSAAGTPTVTWGTSSGTPAVTASAPLVITAATGNLTLSGTTAEFNTALSDGDFATLAGSETLTNKTLTSPIMTTPTLGVAAATSINFGGTALANYVEGTWTPTITTDGTVGTPAYTTQVGTYERIGRFVRGQFSIVLSGWTGSPTGNASIAGLPLTSANTANDYGGGLCASYLVAGLAANNYSINGVIAPNTATMSLQSAGNNVTTQVTAAHLGATAILRGSFWYHV